MVQRYKFESKSQQPVVMGTPAPELFPMVQRYGFESKSQRLEIAFHSKQAVSNGSKIQISSPLHLLTKR